jgi:DNA-binding HxlR family transcriptional regulator
MNSWLRTRTDATVGFACVGQTQSTRRMEKTTRNRLLTLEIAVDLLGDRWSLLIVRDMLVSKSCCFSELMKLGDGIATNILASRLQKLVAHGILGVERSLSDRRKRVYSLTAKGADLLPILTEMVRWSAKYRSKVEPTRPEERL